MPSSQRSEFDYRDSSEIPRDALVVLFAACLSPAAEIPEELLAAISRADGVVTLWDGRRLVGLASALTDGQLVVYYSHVLVHPEYQQYDIGQKLIRRLMSRYANVHQHVLLADSRSLCNWGRLGFRRAGSVSVMWMGEGAVPDGARAYLPALPTTPHFWQVLIGREFPLRHRAAIGLWAALLVAAIVAAMGFFGDEESVVFTGPIVAVVGAMFAAVAWPVRTWRVLLFGLSAPFTIGAAAILAALNPREADEIFAIVVVYAIVVLFWARSALAALTNWPSDDLDIATPAALSAANPWQFSLKSVLWVMTGVAVVSAICHLLFSEIRQDELRLVALFGLLNLSICGGVIGRFTLERMRFASTLSRGRAQ